MGDPAVASPSASDPVLTLPPWLGRPSTPSGPGTSEARRVRLDFVARTLVGALEVVRRALYAEEIARRDGLLQRASPEVKILCFLALILAAGLSRGLAPLALLYGGCVLLAALGRLDLRSFLGRTGLVVLFFTGLIVLPGMTSLVHPGEPLVVLVRFGPDARLGPLALPSELSLTRQGLTGGLMVMLRAATSVSLVTLLTVTTGWFELLRGLRALGLPAAVGMLFTLTYRYIFVLLTVVQDMYAAWQARVLGGRAGDAGRRLGAAAAYALFLRSEALAREIHQAMLARGFQGRVAFVQRRRSSVWASGALAALTLLMLGGVYVVR
jgi:cobalt/nickel transport system permease protein